MAYHAPFVGHVGRMERTQSRGGDRKEKHAAHSGRVGTHGSEGERERLRTSRGAEGGEEVRAAAGDERTEGRAEELPLPLSETDATTQPGFLVPTLWRHAGERIVF